MRVTASDRVPRTRANSTIVRSRLSVQIGLRADRTTRSRRLSSAILTKLVQRAKAPIRPSDRARDISDKDDASFGNERVGTAIEGGDDHTHGNERSRGRQRTPPRRWMCQFFAETAWCRSGPEIPPKG